MAEGGGETSSSTTGGALTGASLLPWHLIPELRPGETDINDYARRMTFLSGIWPKEHMTLLAPRAALCCQGSAFQKVVRLSPETLGGVWGKTTLENRFERFERAIYTTSQRADETHESYMARHEVQFEDLLAQGLSDIRAYILLRNSGLSAEDKRRVIVEAEGDLTYAKVTKSLKLLGSKFFREVQTGSKSGTRNKTYDINYTQEDQETEWIPETDDMIYMASTGLDDATLEAFQAEGDEDALVIQQFEDQVRASPGPIVAVWNNASLPAGVRSATRWDIGKPSVLHGRRTTCPTVHRQHSPEWSLCHRRNQMMTMSHPVMLLLSLSRTFPGRYESGITQF